MDFLQLFRQQEKAQSMQNGEILNWNDKGTRPHENSIY